MNKINDRTGEISIASNGMKMQIVEYRGTYDVDIQFEDGVVVKNKSYKNFKRGCIQYPKPDRVGEIGTATNGMKMRVIAYRSATDIDIQFEDGTIVTNKSYGDFKRGYIQNSNLYRNIRVGETTVTCEGMKIKIIKYNGANDIDVQFEDGTILTGKQYSSFKRGTIRYPVVRVGEIGTSNCGMCKMKIISYRSNKDVDVQFEDGTIVTNRSYAEFKRGAIKNPNLLKLNPLKEEREGIISVATNGMKMKLISYRSYSDVDIQFEDGTIVEHKNFYNFKEGTIFYPKRKDTIITAYNGIRMRVLEYRKSSDIDVQFEDGLVVTNKSITSFEKGSIAYTGIKLFQGNKVKGNFCNYTLKFVAYRIKNDVYYICEDKCGNRDILTPQQMMEKSGIKAVF